MLNGNLPNGWMLTTLREVVTDRKGKMPTNLVTEQQDGFLPYIDIRAFEKGIYRKFATKSSGIAVDANDVLLVWDGARSGLVGEINSGILGSTLSALRPINVNKKYVYYFLMSKYHEINTNTRGIGIPHIDPGFLWSLDFPIAPMPEQERIVAKIEEFFTQLEAGTVALKRVRAGLKRYKASVLKAAMEGRLFDAQEGRTPSAPTSEGGLSEGWRWVKLEEIAETIGGVTKGRKFNGKPTVELPYLRVANVQRGKLELEVMKEIEILASEIDKYLLHYGDVVLTEGGDWDKLGRSAIWRNQIPNCIHQNHIFRARVKESDVLPEWLMYYTNSEQGKDYFKESAKQTTNLASINLTQLRACPIPLPPLTEQKQIVEEVEQRLSVAAAIESVLVAAERRAGRLRQSVLKSAFEGRLV